MIYEVETCLKNGPHHYNLLLPFLCILLIFFDFYHLGAKNGFLYVFSLTVVLCVRLFSWTFFKSQKNLRYALILVFATSFFIMQHVKEQSTWIYLTQDISKGLETEKYSNWKYGDNGGSKFGQLTPIKNNSNVNVSITTYERIAWFKEGIKLIPKYPLGYGLIQDSFKYLGLKEWPDSELSHTHSGWVDLALGVGLPGVLLIFGAIIIAFSQCLRSDNYYARSGILMLPFISFVFLTSEMCEKLSFEFFIFIIVFYATVSLPRNQKEESISFKQAT